MNNEWASIVRKSVELVFIDKFTWQNFDQVGKGGGRNYVVLEVLPGEKHSFRNLFPKILWQIKHKKIQSRFLLEQLRWLPLKGLFLRQDETRRTCLGLPYPTEFLSLLPESLRTCACKKQDE